MLIDIIIMYGLIYISVFLHEMMHYLFARIAGIAILRVNIGFEPLGLRLGSFTVSPVLGPSYIEVSTEQLNISSRFFKVLFCGSGILGNMILVLILVIAYAMAGSVLCIIGVLANIIMIVMNSIPVGRTDMALLKKNI